MHLHNLLTEETIMAALLKRFWGNKKKQRPFHTAWADLKERQEFKRTLESWKETPIELMVQ
jgi:hypothetical protein